MRSAHSRAASITRRRHIVQRHLSFRRIASLLLIGGASAYCMIAPPAAVCAHPAPAESSATAGSPPPAEQHFEQGRQAYEAGDYERAQGELEQALKLQGEETGRYNVSPPASDNMPHTINDASHTTPSAPPVKVTPPPLSVGAATAWESAKGSRYLISSGDILNITVWQVPDLSRETIVGPEGKLSYPLAGEIPAEGLTLQALSQVLTERLKLYVREPQVTVELKQQGRDPRVIVLGEVNQQGVFRFGGHLISTFRFGRTVTVPESLALAGGVRRIGAKVRDVVVIKDYPKNPQLFHVDVQTLLTTGQDPQRLLVEDGDIVFVSRTWVGNVHLFIEAASPMLSTIFQGISAYTLYDNFSTKNNKK